MTMMPGRLKSVLCAAIAAIGLASPALSATIVLDFEGIDPIYPSTSYPFVQNFYDGGTSSAGTSGTNFGVGFSSNAQAICLNTIGSSCSNTSRGGQGDPNSQLGALFFLSGSQTYMNVAAGFTTGFSFFYTAIFNTGSIDVYDGLNGTGNILASLFLPTTPSTCVPGYGAGFCPFVASGVGFAGTALSVAFGGVANQVVFDDVTFGSVIPNPPAVPLPATLPLLLAGVGGLAALRRKLRT